MNRFNRLKASLTRDGIFMTIKKIVKKINYKVKFILKKILYPLYFIFKKIKNYKNYSKSLKQLKNILGTKNFSKIIIFENNFGWSQIMKQRPQQIAENFDNDVLFIYGSSYSEYDSKNHIQELKSNLFLIDLGFYRNVIIKLLQNYESKYLMIYSTDYIPLSTIEKYHNHNFKILYEYVDDIDEKLCGEETAKLLFKRHSRILNNLNPYVICTANKLLNNVQTNYPNANVKLVTNGTDFEHFSKTSQNIPKDLKQFIKKENLLIGYYGALASWFDYEAIKELATENKNYQIILLGLDYDKTIGESHILDLPNVHYLGKKTYEELPDYLQYFDICTIPFIINEITNSTSPVKIFEYMSAGKPIVTTDLPECKKYSSVFISKTHKDFIDNIKMAEAKKQDKNYIELLQKEALANTWKSKCQEIIMFIN